MKMKKKGKVYPSPPPPSSSSSSSFSSHHLNENDSLSFLRLLPAAILVLVSALSGEDREVLAYLITRGTTISARGGSSSSSSSSASVESKKKTTKKNKSSKNHKPPVFDCECFDCYTNYWFRWDSSPNRELIHEIIEAFENHHLTIGGENSTSRNKSKRAKKKEKSSRLVGDKEDKPVVEVEPETESIVSESYVSSPDNSSGRLIEAEVVEREPREVEEVVEEEEEEESTVVFPAADATEHKGLARKVLPDVLGLFNSNFWRLWNPNA
ncbi:hypothetical protein EUTSA_v10015811mg [Eutrema salsugineum]|uniref:Uncharacterized protein n=1 Tax=Eutrema salsugineum TaxID=72664 RepID=V4LN36_EUTSA|nr:uncharacterized protein LOC18016752 [Eutrema salsugineum]ESQ41248.1 hypothetical protein EUTSA_v10015811mg [Eutrema salsugineum]